jgi:molybdopterin converting factor small subunit
MAEVRLLGGLRRRLGARSLRIPAQRVRELLEALVEHGGSAVANCLYADPRARPLAPHRDLRVLVNGRSIAFLEGLDTLLHEEDEVTIHLTGARGYPGG